jgi:hypothetical protein
MNTNCNYNVPTDHLTACTTSWWCAFKTKCHRSYTVQYSFFYKESHCGELVCKILFHLVHLENRITLWGKPCLHKIRCIYYLLQCLILLDPSDMSE